MKSLTFLLLLFLVGIPLSSSAQSPSPAYKIQVGGKDTWPPQGVGCEQFVSCCAAAEKKESSAGLFCKLSASKQPVNCVEGLKNVNQYLKEKAVAAPIECTATK